MSNLTTAHEFGTLIRQELDLEALLRTTLEFILTKTGPTNAAIFLPSTSGDYSLGAYVNYACPRETVDILLDHMANVIAPRFEDTAGIAHLATRAQVEEMIGDDANWLEDSTMIGFPCRHEGECLAIFVFFREAKQPYTETLVSQLRSIRDVFASQIARVIRIHHRHLPKEKWGMLGDYPEDRGEEGGGLAA